MDRVCKIKDCDNKVQSRGWCDMHYQRWYRNGDPFYKATAANGEWRGCKVEDCNKKHMGLGYCHKHYSRFKRHGDPNVNLSRKHYTCTIINCNDKHKAHGMCVKHYRDWYYNKHGTSYRKSKSEVLMKHGMLCVCCGDIATELDHVIPKSLGGSHDLDNLQPMCRLCNTHKSNREKCTLIHS